MNFKGIRVLDAFGNLNSRSRFPTSYHRCKNNMLRQICRVNGERATSAVPPSHGHSAGLRGDPGQHELRQSGAMDTGMAQGLAPGDHSWQEPFHQHPPAPTPCTSTSSSPQNPWPSEPGRDVLCCLSLLWHRSRQPSSVKHQQGAVPVGGKLGRPSKENVTLAKQTEQRCSHSGVQRQHRLGHGHTRLHFQRVILHAGRWMYISLQIHRERKGDGKSIVHMISRSHLAWLLISTQLCYSQIRWMTNALLETFCAGDPQPSYATCSHASPSKSFSFCLTLLSHLKPLFFRIQNQHKEHISLPFLFLRMIPLCHLQPLLQTEQPNPSLFPLRLHFPGCQTENSVVSWTIPSHLTAFWLHDPHK